MAESPVLVLLAGGKSSRMGTPKGLLDYHGAPWILEQVSRFKVVKNPKVYIGLGYNYEKYLDAIPWFKSAIDKSFKFKGIEVNIVINQNPEFGPFSTLQNVLKNIDSRMGVIVQPIDVPLLHKQDLISIINEINSIIIPTCNDKNGHPVKLMPDFWLTLLHVDLASDMARLDSQISRANNLSITYLKVMDNAVNQNINTNSDWINFID